MGIYEMRRALPSVQPRLEFELMNSIMEELLAGSIFAMKSSTLTLLVTVSGTLFRNPHRLQLTLKPVKWSGTTPSQRQPQHLSLIIDCIPVRLVVLAGPHRRGGYTRKPRT
jgi:hypothetical protein